MYKLFIANKNYSSWSLRPWILMRELGITFEEKLVPFADDSSWELFRRFSPSGKVPCLLDGDSVVWDSMGITEYLAERREGIWPEDSRARTWARCAAAEMHSGFGALREICSMSVGIRVQLYEINEDLARDIARLDEVWSEGLSKFGGPFLAGKTFTAVDAFYAPVVFRVQTYRLALGAAAMGYVEHMLSLHGMQAWESDALDESWRDLQHENFVIKYGRVTSDLRKS
ncbi:MAG: glutathione S-transferase family protein [Pseudohongiella sp.]|nr:glutathione S-transferase family protein [Pseudohongiella sp.]